jgi:hypothetical protein
MVMPEELVNYGFLPGGLLKRKKPLFYAGEVFIGLLKEK